MTRQEVYQRVEDMIREEKGEDIVVDLQASLAETIAADSVEVMEFVISLEDEFGVDVPDAAIERFETAADMVDFIYENLEKRS